MTGLPDDPSDRPTQMADYGKVDPSDRPTQMADYGAAGPLPPDVADEPDDTDRQDQLLTEARSRSLANQDERPQLSARQGAPRAPVRS